MGSHGPLDGHVPRAQTPSQETPTKSATLDDLRTLERGCLGDRTLDLRDRAIVSVLVTTTARTRACASSGSMTSTSSARSSASARGKGGKTLDVALHPETRSALSAYVEGGRLTLLESLLRRARLIGRSGLGLPLGGGRGAAAAHDERLITDGHPPLPRRRREAPDVRLAPDPPWHGDPSP